MQYYKNKNGTTFNFENNVFIVQPGQAIPDKLPKDKSRIFVAREKLTEINDVEPIDLQVQQETKTVEEFKKQLLKELKQKRKEFEISGVEIEGKIWGSKLKDETRLNSALRYFEINPDKKIRNFVINDGFEIDLTKEVAKVALTKIMEHYELAFKKELEKQKEINSIKTLKSLQAYKEQGRLDF